MQNSIYKIKYLLFLPWDSEAWCLTQSGGGIPLPTERNTAWNKGRKCFHCLGAPNNLIHSWLDRKAGDLPFRVPGLWICVVTPSLVNMPSMSFMRKTSLIFISIISNSRKTSKINYDKGFLALLIGLDQHFKGFNWTFLTKLQQLLSR